MGQKVNPHGLRVGIIKDWDAKWYAEKDFADNLVEDVKIRKFIKKRLYDAGISKITIERTAGRVKISVYTAKPGIVIGKNGASIEALKAELQKMTAQKVAVNIEEVKRPELEDVYKRQRQDRYRSCTENQRTAGRHSNSCFHGPPSGRRCSERSTGYRCV